MKDENPIKKAKWVEDKKEFDFITGRTFKHSRVLAYISWASVFGIIWLSLFHIIPLDSITWGFWVFSIFIAIVSSAYSTK